MGDASARTSWVSCSPAGDNGSTDGTTLSQVPRGPSKRLVVAAGAGTAAPVT